jgi:propanol-preferring alcohol dehydrogenase
MQAAPLLCAGLIGFRALQMAPQARHLGLYGFGAAAHLAIQVALGRGQQVYAFTRPDDREGQAYARSLGAVGRRLGPAAAAPAGCEPDLRACRRAGTVGAGGYRQGGCVICAGIHMSDIPSFPYRLLWGERSVRSVANLTRQDGTAFFDTLQHTPCTAISPALP